MGSGALGVAQLHGARFGFELSLDDFGELIRGARKDRMTESVEAGFIRSDLFTVLAFEPFANSHDTKFVGIDRLLHLGEEALFVESDFWNENDVRRAGCHASARGRSRR